MSRHAIHLGNAWESPADAGDAWLRRFGLPTGIEPDDRMHLVCERSAAVSAGRPTLALLLNGTPLPPIESGAQRYEYDITPLLRERNELVVRAEPAGDARPDSLSRGQHGRVAIPEDWGRIKVEIVSR